MPRIMAIAQRHKLQVIEDACQAHMSSIAGKNLGTFGTTGCFSFQTSKTMPIGEGGAIITDDAELDDKLRSYHNYGFKTKILPGSYDNIAGFILGNKIRMAEYQAAIGLCQIRKLEENTRIRNENAAYLTPRLAAISGITPVKPYPGVDRLSYYMYPFIYDETQFNGLHAHVRQGVFGEGFHPVPDIPSTRSTAQDSFMNVQDRGVSEILHREELDWEG